MKTNLWLLLAIAALIVLGAVSILYKSDSPAFLQSQETAVKLDAQEQKTDDQIKDSQLDGGATVDLTRDEDFRSVFTVRGNTDGVVFEGKGPAYYITDKSVYVVDNIEYEGFFEKLLGGDAYIIAGADARTFEVLPSFLDASPVGKDKDNVYFEGKIVKGIKPANFTLGTDYQTCEYTDGTTCYNLTTDLAR
jgi:hypothetical protein